MKIRPLRDFALLLDLPEETARLASSWIRLNPGQFKSPGWFCGRILALPGTIDGLKVGDKVLVQGQSQPLGAGWIPSEEFGLSPGQRVILVPVRSPKSPVGSEELVERRNLIVEFEKDYPVSQYPKTHPFWKESKGQALLVQLGEHIRRIAEIKAAMRGKARNRLFPPSDDTKLGRVVEGILAVIEDDEPVYAGFAADSAQEEMTNG